MAAFSLGEEETAHKRTLESLVKRASKPNKKITKASQLLPVHGLLSNVFGCVLGVECDTRQNPRRYVVFIEIQPNEYNKYLFLMAGITLIFFGVVSFCIFDFRRCWGQISKPNISVSESNNLKGTVLRDF